MAPQLENRRVAAVWPIAQPGPQKRRLARPRRAEDDEQRLHTRGAHPPQHFQAAHDLGVASEEHRRIGLLQRCPAPIRGTVGITPAAATRSAPRRLSGRVAPACGQTCWYSAAFVVAPRPSFEFRGPFGDACACGKIGCGRSPRSVVLGAVSPFLSLIRGAGGGAAHCRYEHEGPTLFHPCSVPAGDRLVVVSCVGGVFDG